MNFENFQSWIGPNFKVLVSILGAVQGFILAVIVLFYPHKHRTSNRLLFAFIFVQAYLLIAIRFAEWVQPELAWIIYSVRLLVFILLYLYIKSLYTRIRWQKEWYHLLLLVLDVALIRALVLFKIPIVMETGVNFYEFFGSTLEIVFLCWMAVSMLFYFFIIKNTIVKYRKKVEQNFSDLNQLGVKWVKMIFYGKFLLEFTDYLSFYIVFEFLGWYIPYHGIINALLSTAFMYFLTIKGKLSPQIYQLRMVEEKQIVALKESDQLNISKEIPDELHSIAAAVQDIMENDQLYLQDGLSVKELAERLEVQPYLVSQAINTCLEKNFFDLVNGYRVEQAKKLMLDDSLSHLSMIGIAFEAGFSSKTAFNIAFKKFTGLTPSEYKKEALEQNQRS